MNTNNNSKEVRAKLKLEEIKKFYSFLASSIIASVFMVGMAVLIFAGDAPYAKVPILIFLSTPIVFTVIVLIEYVRVYEKGLLCSKQWEEQQILKHIQEQKKTTTKYI